VGEAVGKTVRKRQGGEADAAGGSGGSAAGGSAPKPAAVEAAPPAGEVAPRVLLPSGLTKLVRDFLIAESLLNYGFAQTTAENVAALGEPDLQVTLRLRPPYAPCPMSRP